jgi:hypothetical protein
MNWVSWTTLVTEYLIIGLQGAAILTMVGLRLEGRSLESLPALLSSLPGVASALLGAVGFAFVYSLGLLLDRTWDSLVNPMCKTRVRRLWLAAEKSARTPGIGQHFYRAEADLYGVEGTRDQLMRRRGRIRVLRALLFHIPLLAVAILLHHASLWISATAILLEVATVIAFLQVHKQYVLRVAYHHAGKAHNAPMQQTGSASG